jgi:Tol biopolymer transport system component
MVPRGTSILKLLFVISILVSTSGCGWVAVATVGSNGQLGNGDSEYAWLSNDGRYVAFDSISSNLVAGDINPKSDVFLRDLKEGVTTLVSVNTEGTQGNNGSYDASISDDGRVVAFLSRATNLVANDTNGMLDIFVHDRNTLTTTRVSVSSDGVEGNSSCFSPTISADGRYVAFESDSSNLVALDTNNQRDVFVHDLNTGITTRVSVDSAGGQAAGGSDRPYISANGRYVAFNSSGLELAQGESLAAGVFVHDRNTGATTLVSVNSAGEPANGYSNYPAISADGRYVTFRSDANNLVPGDTNARIDIFVHDRSTGKTTRASVNSMGVQGNDSSLRSMISGDGRYVTFASWATNLVANDTNSKMDIFIHDTISGNTRRASLGALGTQANDESDDYHAISGNGRYVAFASSATNLVPDDVNDAVDIFIRAVPHLTVSSVTPKMLPAGATTQIVVQGSDFLPGTQLAVDDATVSNLILWNENVLSANVTVSANLSSGARDVKVILPGTGAGPLSGSLGLCDDCVTFF